MNIRLFLVGALAILAGCTNDPQLSSAPSAAPTVSPTTGNSPAIAPTSSPSAPAPAVSDTSSLISSRGIGVAELGMTLGTLKQTLPQAQFEVQPSFMVDFDAIAVRQNGQVQFYILHLAEQPLSDSDVVQGLLTDNSDYKTAEGIGAGSSIGAAADVYGKATLAYSTANESREYVRFERQPSSNISFATGNAGQDPAGIYPTPAGEYNETEQFKDTATIQSVLVVCLASGCAK